MKKQTPIRVPFDTKAHWIAEDKLTRDDRRDRYASHSEHLEDF
jgi:hypothetical protein